MSDLFRLSSNDVFSEQRCYFCGETQNFVKKFAGTWGNDYYCPHCGHYQISREVIINLHVGYNFRALATAIAQERKLTGQDDYVLQWRNIPENDNEHQVCIGDIPFLNNYPNDYLEKLDRILINIGRKTNNSPLISYQPNFYDFGLFFIEPPENYYSCETIPEDVMPFVNEKIDNTINIIEEIGWIQKQNVYIGSIPTINLTINGLKHLRELHNISENKTQAFLAMWFTNKKEYLSKLNIYVDSITKAVGQTGYSGPYRVDKEKYNDFIMNKVINQIKESRFLIADLTCDEEGTRGGVYYEAGLAAGLGMPVILTCYKETQSRVHFDLKQFNTILWYIDDNGIIRVDGHPDEDFSEYLTEWIIATVGKKK